MERKKIRRGPESGGGPGADRQAERIPKNEPGPVPAGIDPMRWKALDGFLKNPQIPSDLQDLVLQYIGRKIQKPWDDPKVLERIRQAIVFQKGRYWDERPGKGVPYGKAYRTIAYLTYHMPVYFIQTEHLLRELAAEGLLKPDMRILDVGSGPGVISLAVTDFLRRLGGPAGKITLMAIEQDEEHNEAYRSLVPVFTRSTSAITIENPIPADIRKLPDENIPDGIDLLVFSNIINELRDLSPEGKADLIMRYTRNLAPDGTILIVEPADKTNSTGLRKMTAALNGKGLTIYSPCTFLWGTTCRPESCWSFEEKPSLMPTLLMQTVAGDREPFRYLNTDIKYSYVILRKDKRTRIPYRIPAHAKAARLSSLGSHTGRRISVVASVMSGDIGNRTHHVFKICDGTAREPVFAIMPKYHRTEGNAELTRAGYGEILVFRNVLVRFNEKEKAYNLLVTRETKVERTGEENTSE